MVIYLRVMMRGEIFKNWRIVISILFSATLIVGAYLLARGAGSPSVAEASTETALLQAIATKDSSGDGLPDWQKVLYGIPVNATTTDYFHLGMTDGEAVARGLIVPRAVANVSVATSTAKSAGGVDYASAGLTSPSEGTLTDAFAKGFFALYLSAKQANGGVDLTASQTNTLAEQALSQLSQSISSTSDFKKATDITVSGSGPDALRAFATAAEAVMKKNKNDATMSEIEYFQLAVQGDAGASAHLVSLADSYRDSALGLAALPVPKELAAVDLAIVNAIMRLSEIDRDFSRVATDPLTAMLALQQYKPTELAAEQAFANLANIYVANGVILSNGTPGASFVNVMANITAEQRAATKTP